jgi:hypothetical protein
MNLVVTALFLGFSLTAAASDKGTPPNDAVTAGLRAAFSKASVPDATTQKMLAAPPFWTCNYHAAVPSAAFNGSSEVVYAANYANTDFLTTETVADVHDGDLAYPGWRHLMAVSRSGLRFDSDGGDARSEVLRIGADGNPIVEFLFLPLGGRDPDDGAVADPDKDAMGYAICTPASERSGGSGAPH